MVPARVRYSPGSIRRLIRLRAGTPPDSRLDFRFRACVVLQALRQVDFTDILPNTSIMAITVAFSMSQGVVLPPQEVRIHTLQENFVLR